MEVAYSCSGMETKLKVSGFEKSLEGEQVWPPKTFDVKKMTVGIDWAEGKDETVVVKHHETERKS